ncbi:hypothetical protein, partial [Ulvibacterium marinum]|uniref:hypothetical protein n=1 Tax=Ulvibacterium marinum TaxID=2419782 RepID=UPI0024947FAD
DPYNTPTPSAPAPCPDHLPLLGEGPAKDRPTRLQGNLCSLELKYRMNRKAFLSLAGKGGLPRKRKVGKGRSKALAEQNQSKRPATRTTPPPLPLRPHVRTTFPC